MGQSRYIEGYQTNAPTTGARMVLTDPRECWSAVRSRSSQPKHREYGKYVLTPDAPSVLKGWERVVASRPAIHVPAHEYALVHKPRS